MATWGEVINRMKQSKNDEKNTGKEVVNESAADSSISESETHGDNDFVFDDNGNSLFSQSNFMDAGVGNAIVCQVIPSMNSMDAC